MSNNTWDDPRITAYVLDGLTDEERTQFEIDLKNNPDLAAATEEARGLTEQLQGIYTAEPVAPLDEERRQEIAAEQLAVSPVHIESSSAKFVWVAVAIAACVLLLVGVAPYLTRDSLNPTVTQLPIEGVEELAEAVTTEAEEFLSANQDAAGSSQSSRDAALLSQAQGEMEMEESSDGQNVADGDFDMDDFDEAESAGAASVPSSRPPVPMPALTPPAPAETSGPRVARRSTDQASSRPEVPELERFGDSLQSSPIATPSVANSRNLQSSQAGEQEDLSGRQAMVAGDNAPSGSMSKALSDADPFSDSAMSPGNEAGPGDTSTPFGDRGLPGVQNVKEEADLEMPAAPGDQPNHINAAATVENAIEIAAANSRGNQPSLRSSGGREKKDTKVSRLELPSASTPASDSGFGSAEDEGRGAGIGGDRFDPITDNAFKRVGEHPFSTFSVDVDTASYSKVRDFLTRGNQLPRPDAVRIEELLNYFDYDYPPPSDDADHPFTAHTVVTGCPWNADHRLARIALQGKTMRKDERPPCNLVFLLDTSGSMNAPNKLPLVVEGMKMLVDQLGENDKVAIAVYAGSAGLVLDSTEATKQKKIRNALTQLNAGGSTNGGAGIALAYQTAREHFIDEGVNRVILCTDGDFNVGTTGTDSLVRMIEQQAKGGIFLSVLGFGMGNHNDAMLEQISGRGNGNYAYIDTPSEAHKVLVEQTSGTLVTIAKDVKLQIEFNPQQVSSYRLIGYENRVLANEDFNDDKKDAGEIGAGHSVTALYELVPAGVEADAAKPLVDDLKYQSKPELTAAANSNELMTLKLRYKRPNEGSSSLVEFPVIDDDLQFEDSDSNVQFAAAVAGFGMQLRRSEYAGSWTLADVIEVAQAAKGEDLNGLRNEFVQLAQIARRLMGQE
ncbi:MAG: von Willebrand factor type A domain-containing protein [Planctomycetota bacterium]|nr:von Willebrand factor type A domain-containing protein [Planctomycetota bacterium]